MGWIGDELEHPPCMLQIEKIPVDIMTTCLTVITPGGEEEGGEPRHASFTASYQWVMVLLEWWRMKVN
jgi:hypothetical protein